MTDQVVGGPGYYRMIERLGADGYAKLCADNLRLRDEALARASDERPGVRTDRASYSKYPRAGAPRRKK